VLQLRVPSDMVVVQVRAHHQADFVRLRAGRGEALEIGRLEHAPPGPRRAHAIVAAAGVDQDLLAADLEQPAVHAELDLAARRLVVARCEPAFMLAQNVVGELRKDFPRIVDREVGFLDAGYGCLADRMLEHASLWLRLMASISAETRW